MFLKVRKQVQGKTDPWGQFQKQNIHLTDHKFCHTPLKICFMWVEVHNQVKNCFRRKVVYKKENVWIFYSQLLGQETDTYSFSGPNMLFMQNSCQNERSN